MLTIQIVILGLQGVFLGLFLFFTWKQNQQTPDDRLWFQPLEEMKLEMEVQQTRWKRFLEEASERIDRGNDAWRRYQTAQRARERRQQEREEELELEEQEVLDLRPQHEEGSDPRGLQYLREPVDPATQSPWQDVAKAIAHGIAGRGVN